MMKTTVNSHLEGVLDLTERMVKMADQGMVDDSVDNGFYLLYGIIRDNAYTIRNAAVHEYAVRHLIPPVKYNTRAK